MSEVVTKRIAFKEVHLKVVLESIYHCGLCFYHHV